MTMRIEMGASTGGRRIARGILAVGVLAVGLFLCTVSCERAPAPQRASNSQNTSAPVDERTVELAIGGMSCDSCTPAVKGVLKKVEGVMRVEVRFEEKKAVVVYDSARTSPEKLADAVNATRVFTARVVHPGVPNP